jgi:acetyl-CoA synthetase (ADP-forming)
MKVNIREFIQSIGEEKVVLEHEAKGLLKDLGLRVPKGVFIRRRDEIPSSIAGLTYPLVAKSGSRAIRSKVDAGGVRLGIKSADELRTAFDGLMKVMGAEGVLVEEMAPEGIEAIAGGIIDPHFGPVVMFGMGGFFAEAMRDMAFALAPVDREKALWLASQIKGYTILKGIRGRPPVDMEALSGALVLVSEIIATGIFSEIDLNPLVLYPDGAVVLDAKMFVKG